MIAGGKLLAWIESRGDKVVAAFIGVMPPTWENPRDPATRTFASLEDARRWVESEGRALAVPIEWVKHSASPARTPRPNQAAPIGSDARRHLSGHRWRHWLSSTERRVPVRNRG